MKTFTELAKLDLTSLGLERTMQQPDVCKVYFSQTLSELWISPFFLKSERKSYLLSECAEFLVAFVYMAGPRSTPGRLNGLVDGKHRSANLEVFTKAYIGLVGVAGSVLLHHWDIVSGL